MDAIVGLVRRARVATALVTAALGLLSRVILSALLFLAMMAPIARAGTINAVAGTSFSGQVAETTVNISGCAVASVNATIDWGDGTASSQGAVTYTVNGAAATLDARVSGTHTYQASGTFPGAVSGNVLCQIAQVKPREQQAFGFAGDPPFSASFTAIVAPVGSPPPPPQPPDFALTGNWPAAGIAVTPGGESVDAVITLHRYNDPSNVPINFSLPSLPTGIHVIVAPDPDSDGDGSTLKATFTADPGTPTQQFTVTLTGNNGTTSHSIDIPVTVANTYGLQIQGMEITQGVQTFTLPHRDPANPTAPVPYSGVILTSNKPTVVRVFADAPSAPSGGVAPSATLTVYGVNGQPLGTPLTPVSFPAVLTDPRSSTVTPAERANPTASFDFALPDGWIARAASMTARLLPPTSFLTQPIAIPCTVASCVALRSLTVDGISTVNVGTIRFGLVELTINGSGPDPLSTLDWTERLLPTRLDVSNILGTVDVSWIANGCPNTGLCSTNHEQRSFILSFLEDYASHTAGDDALLGVTTANYGDENSQTFQWGSEPVAVVDYNRPITDVTHEIGHMFNLPHASSECGGGGPLGPIGDGDDEGQTGESWLPDQQGYIDGIGLNIGAGPPYEVIAGPGRSNWDPNSSNYQCATNQSPPECGGSSPQQFFDFMSYCEAADPDPSKLSIGQGNAWISVRNWDYIAEFSKCFGAGGAGYPSYLALGEQCWLLASQVKNADAAAAAAQQLQAGYPPAPSPGVLSLLRSRPAAHIASAAHPTTEAAGAGMVSTYGFEVDGKMQIGVVDPTPSTRRLSGTKSGMRLVLMGTHRKPLSTAPVLTIGMHIDHARNGELLLAAVRNHPGATALAIEQHGKIMAIRHRPRELPRVRLLSPRRNTRLKHGRKLVVRWRIIHGGRAPLMVSVDLSTNSGRTWQIVYMGVNTSHATIPRNDLRRSKHERVRVLVNDGFDQVSATSAPFRLH